VEWRITRGGERRTVKEDQYFIDEKAVVWGRGNVNPLHPHYGVLPRKTSSSIANRLGRTLQLLLAVRLKPNSITLAGSELVRAEIWPII